ncbi:MAG TPA: SAM-dependent chlorinase/fluorinase [Candidatus Thermoplasmatota archaeon]|nr:SAM-dependent chlorinase/fluorinase [Candidatus Thermoplasmatota archaeon]
MLVSLTTDFGPGAYAGAMRGAILDVSTDVRVVDITHTVPAHDVVQGALALLAAAPHFPRGTVHVCVVDPGVGTARRPIVVESDRALFVGPDNGVLMPAAERLGFKRALLLDKPDYWRTRVSPVFHGRDLFGPVAAHLARGVDPAKMGTRIDDPVRLDFGHPKRAADGSVDAKVLSVDSFGNLTTNVPEPQGPALGTRVEVRVGGRAGQVEMRRTYGEAASGEDLLLIGSNGFVELAVSRGRADTRWGAQAGQPLRLRW